MCEYCEYERRTTAAQMLRDMTEPSSFAPAANRLGMAPPGPDVDWMERREAEQRMGGLSAIAEPTAVLCDTAADVVARMAALVNADASGEPDVEPDPEELWHTRVIVRMAVMAVLGQLIARGYVAVTR